MSKLFEESRNVKQGRITEKTLENLRFKLQRSGIRGFIDLARRLRGFDIDGDRTLSHSSFRNVLRDIEFIVSDEHLQYLLEHFDKKNKNRINYEEFLASLRVSY